MRALPYVFCTGLLLLSLSSAAHHGAAGLFEESTIEITGAVKEWTFVNPHPVLVLEVTGEDGSAADWDVYFGPSAVSALRRRGFSESTFSLGETVVVTGHPAVAAGVLGIDVWGADSHVTRADGTNVP
jgi:hypothetical protein